MGLKGIDKAYAALPARGPWDQGHVAELAQAAGDRVKAAEAERFAAILAKDWRRFQEPARRSLEVLAGVAAPDREPLRFTLGGAFTTGIAEQSGLAYVSRTFGFLVVDDESGTLWRLPYPAASKGALDATKVLRDDRLAGLEGGAYDGDSRSALMVSEASGEVFEIALGEAGVQGKLRPLGTLPDISSAPNKGWEGLAILPAQHSGDGRSRLLAVHEGYPLALGIFDRHDLTEEKILDVPESWGLGDLSDVAFDPRSGHLFLLSDESGCVVEVELRRTASILGQGALLEDWALIKLGETQLPPKLGKDLQAEGLSFDDAGDLWVSYERGAGLLRLTRH